MSSDVVSRWPIVLSSPVTPADRDVDGRLTDAAARRLFAAGRAAYFHLCETVDPTTLSECDTRVLVGDVAVGDESVVSVDVIEIFADRFTMSMRARPQEGPAIAASGRCTLAPIGGVPAEMRDEFIALAHSARHVN